MVKCTFIHIFYVVRFHYFDIVTIMLYNEQPYILTSRMSYQCHMSFFFLSFTLVGSWGSNEDWMKQIWDPTKKGKGLLHSVTSS